MSSLLDLAPKGDLRMSVNPSANGGELLQPLVLPDFRDYAVKCSVPCDAEEVSATKIFGDYLRDVIRYNAGSRNFRIFGPDETASNRLQDVYQATPKQWEGEVLPVDENYPIGGLLCGLPKRIGERSVDPRAARIGGGGALIVPAHRAAGDQLAVRVVRSRHGSGLTLSVPSRTHEMAA